MKIDNIYIAGFKHDINFTRTCVASIRHWYPSIPITLIKDEFYGPYSTQDIEHNYNCNTLKCENTRFGWGFGKLEPLFLPQEQRFLVLDSDIVFAGPILSRLEKFSEDFVVQKEEPSRQFTNSHYFDIEKLRQIDPGFVYPEYTFNTGQWVGISNRLTRDDFSNFITGHPPKPSRPDIFKLGEQGLLNYMLMRNAACGRISLKRDYFMRVGNDPDTLGLKLPELTHGAGYPFLIHWCGLRRSTFKNMARGDILTHFESLYYSRLSCGRIRRFCFYLQRDSTHYIKAFIRSVIQRLK